MGYSKNPAVQAALTKVGNVPTPTPLYRDATFMGALAATTVPFVLDKAWSGGAKLLEARRRGQAFREVLEHNPHLKKYDAKSTHRYFNTLHRVNPEMAKDPLVAGAFLQQQHEMSDPTFPHRGIIPAVEQMVKIRKDTRAGQRGGSGFQSLGPVIQTGVTKSMTSRAAHNKALEAYNKEQAEQDARAMASLRARQQGRVVRRATPRETFDPRALLQEGADEGVRQARKFSSLRDTLGI